MSTPFEFFRRNQKVALAAVTGMAILSFLVQDAISNSGEMSPMGIGTLLVGSLAIVGWVWGAKEGKSGDNALFGALVGAALTLGFMFMSRPPAAMSATTGNMTVRTLNERMRDQSVANRMLSVVFYSSDPIRAQTEQFFAQMGRPNLMLFNYANDLKTSSIISELLNREADELGIEVTDEAVMEHLKQVAGKDSNGEDRLTRQLFDDAIKNTSMSIQGGTNEEMIFESLRRELRARQAANLLLGGNRMTPADVWDLHRKLSVRQTAQVVALPVNDFVKKEALPSDSEARELFEKYKNNIPNYTAPPQPKLEEGRPGFYLDRRMRLAYVEPNYEEIEKQVGEITDAEIQQRYEERYKKEVPKEDIGDGLNLDMPALPSTPKAPAAPAGEQPADAPKSENPAGPPAPPASVPTGDAPADAAKPAAPADSAKPEEAKPAANPATPEKPAEKPVEPAKPEGSSQLRRANGRFQPVALIQEAGADKPAEAAPADAPKADAPAESKPAETPAPAADAKPAAPADPAKTEEAKPADAPAGDAVPPPAGDKPKDAPLTVPPVDTPADEDPAPPVSNVRPLDDALKQQIRQELLNEKMQPLMAAKVDAARDFMNDLQLRVAEYRDHERNLKAKRPSELSADAMSPEAATDEIKKYAKENGLTYQETPLLTLNQLADSDDYPIRGAMVREQPVASLLNQSLLTDLYSASSALRLGENLANYAYWKIEDVAEHAPASMDEPGVKDAVIKAWREQQARPLAENRAKALAEIVSKSDKPMAEALSDQTVTGESQDKSLFVTVTPTGEFSWLQRNPFANQFGSDDTPRLGAVNGVKGAGSRFMTKVFDEMKPGDTAVIPNEDLSVYYLIKLEKRTPATDAELEVMKNNFLSSSSNSLTRFARSYAMSQDGNFLDRLFTKHGVKIASDRSEEPVEN